ncbi:MAG: Fe-S cluster assembly protein SufD [Acidobacteriota bacterium]
MTTPIETATWPLGNFELLEKNLRAKVASRAHKVRMAAVSDLRRTGFPSQRDEDWKYTSVAPILERRFAPVLGRDSRGLTQDDLFPFVFDQHDWMRMVFVNGHWSPELSSTGAAVDGIRLQDLARVLEDEFGSVESLLSASGRDAFGLLNTAFLLDGAYIYVPDGLRLPAPIHLLFLARGESLVQQPRNLVVVGKGSSVTILESYVGARANDYFTNSVTEIIAAEGSEVDHMRIQEDGDSAFHIGATRVRQGMNSRYRSTSVSLGAALTRNNLDVTLDAEGAACTLNGLYLTAGSQHVDNHTGIDHASPRCNSQQLYKGILDGSSRGVFNGKVVVRQDSQKTDAHQLNSNLLLSDQAAVDTKPQLEIFADDVKCTHGAAIGRLDSEAIYYLRTRGLGVAKARAVLTYAFASEVIEGITVEPIREYLDRILLARLERGGTR